MAKGKGQGTGGKGQGRRRDGETGTRRNGEAGKFYAITFHTHHASRFHFPVTYAILLAYLGHLWKERGEER
ncbi:MAG: hypothetical protein ACO2PL_12125 [Armatimonadota bacterium]|jgi:hypothetical protein